MSKLTLIATAAAIMLAGFAATSVPTSARAQSLGATPLSLTPPAKAKKARAAVPEQPRRVVTHRTSAFHAKPQDREGGIVRGQDTVAMIGQLPWWRAAPADIERIRTRETESQVLAAARNWFGPALAETVQVASDDDINDLDRTADFALADPSEFNAIDQGADGAPTPASGGWMTSLFALIGGALAAASTARFLFV